MFVQDGVSRRWTGVRRRQGANKYLFSILIYLNCLYIHTDAHRDTHIDVDFE